MEVIANEHLESEKVYLDHAAATPVDPQVVSVMCHWLTDGYGNPSSSHSLGRLSRNAIQRARHQVAELIGALDSEIIFTSSGTESDNMALCGVLAAAPKSRKRLITSAIEHSAILSNINRLESAGYKVTLLPVDNLGRVACKDLEQALDNDVSLVSIMYANNEVGTIQDIKRHVDIVKPYKALFHTDAVQAVGLLPIDVNELGVDLLSLSAHKIYGPKGMGALYIRQGVLIKPLLVGGGQEFNLRAGTENVPAIVGLGEAAELARQRLKYVDRLKKLRDYLQQELNRIPGIIFYGDPDNKLPNHCCFSISGYKGANLVAALDLIGFYCSSGSACHGLKPSHVLQAMGVAQDHYNQAIRVTLGWSNTIEQIQRFSAVIQDLIAD